MHHAELDKATILQILASCPPIRVQHGRRSTRVEEFLVQWGPEHCMFGDALEQYYLGFDIESITSLESTVSFQDLLPFVATNRPTREQRRSFRRPPLSTNCIVQLAPSPQRPLHIRSIAGGTQALDSFLAREPSSPPASPASVGNPLHFTPIKRSSSAQAPTRTKLRAAPPLPPPPPSSEGRPAWRARPPSSQSRPTRRAHSDPL